MATTAISNETLTSLFGDAIGLFPEDICRINGTDWQVVRSTAQLGARGGEGGLWDTYVFSLTGIKPDAGTVPAPMTRLTYNRAAYQIAGIEQVGTTTMYVIHLANPQRTS